MFVAAREWSVVAALQLSAGLLCNKKARSQTRLRASDS
jgi:hypothetical protein